MKNYSNRYKLVATIGLLFVIAISLMFSFLVGTKQINGNAFYWVFKGIALASLIAIIVMLWFKKASFHKFFPLTLTAVLYQGVPALCRIHNSKGNIPTAMYFIVVILTFLFVVAALLYGVSNDQFKEAENKAKKSSNYPR